MQEYGFKVEERSSAYYTIIAESREEAIAIFEEYYGKNLDKIGADLLGTEDTEWGWETSDVWPDSELIAVQLAKFED